MNDSAKRVLFLRSEDENKQDFVVLFWFGF